MVINLFTTVICLVIVRYTCTYFVMQCCSCMFAIENLYSPEYTVA